MQSISGAPGIFINGAEHLSQLMGFEHSSMMRHDRGSQSPSKHGCGIMLA